MATDPAPYTDADFIPEQVISPRAVEQDADGDWRLTNRALNMLPHDIDPDTNQPVVEPAAESAPADDANGATPGEQLSLPADVAEPIQSTGDVTSEEMPVDLDAEPTLLTPERALELFQLGGLDPSQIDDDDWDAIGEAMERDGVSTPEQAETWLRDYCGRVQRISAELQEKADTRTRLERAEARLAALGGEPEDPAVVQARRLENIERTLLEDRQERAQMMADYEFQQRADLEVGHVLSAVAQATGKPLDVQIHGPAMIDLLMRNTPPDAVVEILAGRLRKNGHEPTTIVEGRGPTARTRTINHGTPPTFVGGSTGARPAPSSGLPDDL